MILKKVNFNGQETYAPISFEEALKYDKKDELVFTDENEKDDFDDKLLEMEELKNNSKKDSSDFDDIKTNISKAINYVSGLASSKKFREENHNTKTSKILKLLPFMDDDDIHEIVQSILDDEDLYKDLDFVAIMPFLEDEDCDLLFKKAVLDSDGKYKYNVASLASFVSEECISNFVDEYLDGKYQNINIEDLFPFMESKDIKKIFKSYINK